MLSKNSVPIDIAEEDSFLRQFEIENDIYFDPEKQIKHKEEPEYEEMDC